MTIEIVTLAVLNDNYIYVLHDEESGQTAVVDPAIAEPVVNLLQERGWQLDYIFNTHHHSDHVGANSALKQISGCQIWASEFDQPRIPAIDRTLKEGDLIHLGKHPIQILETPGHTLGHIVYYFTNQHRLFCGDTLFSLGCGRLFEGTAEQMWHSLQKIQQLPDDTQIYCAHEYTLANGRFALSIEPNNSALQQRVQQAAELRQQGLPTLPSTLISEKNCNPFLRPDSPEIKNNITAETLSAVDTFAQIRLLKDQF